EGVTIPFVELSPSYELTRKYEDFLVSGVAPNALAGVSVVLDTGNGAAYEIAPEVFRRAGAKVHVINDQPNGLNINEDAGALHPERLAQIVRKENAEFGVAFDGDADRAIFVDDWGNGRAGDGIHTALVFGELLARAGRPFSELKTFQPMPQVLLNQDVASKPALESLPRYQAARAEAERELGGQGRILVRYSGTENKVRVMVEGPDETATRKIAEHLRIVLRDEIK